MAKQFQLWVQLVNWRDGDSFKGVLDQGCFVYRGRLDKPIMYRCSLIDAPELPTPEGLAALEFARSIAPIGEYAAVSTGLDQYGRPLLDLITGSGLFSTLMLASGHAVKYKS
jgi:endonuclease YncB( thermonuclease family)